FYVSQTVNGCESDRDSILVTTYDFEDASFSYSSNSYCQAGAEPVITITALGGTFSSDPDLTLQANSGDITLASSSLGTHIIKYLTNGNCPDSATYTIDIVDAANAKFTYDSPTCSQGSNPFAKPADGALTGTFTSSTLTTIDPATGEVDLFTAAIGTHRIFNTVNAGTCGTAIDSFDLVINNGPAKPTVQANFEYCINEAADSLSAIGLGLLWYTDTISGTGDPVRILPTTAAAGSTEYYVSQTQNSCESNKAIITVVVLPVDDASFSYAQPGYCVTNDNPLPDAIATSGGTFSGTGVAINPTTGEIDLSQTGVGAFLIKYVTNNVCPDSAELTIRIEDYVDGSFAYSGVNCIAGDGVNPLPLFFNNSQAGTFTASPAGLVFIDAATGEVDLASSDPNQYVITNTTQTANSCPAGNHTSNIELFSQPIILVDDETINCGGSATLETQVILAGGQYSWTPTGLTTKDITVYPSTTTSYTVNYTVGNGCATTETAEVTVIGIVVTQSDYEILCDNWIPFTLSGGSPTGGTYSGPTVNNNIFNPGQAGIGDHAITYTYSVNGCSGKAQTTLEIQSCVGLSENKISQLIVFPNPSNGLITIQGFNNAQNVGINLYDMTGKIVHSLKDNYSESAVLNLSDLPNGVYWIEVMNDNLIFKERIVIQH
ncbi:MAG: hypothetical protein ACI9XP_000301, partial [Lentimonas sp.]